MNRCSRRILITGDAVGGIWTYTLELIRGLPETEFALCTMGPAPSVWQRAEIAALDNASLFVSPYKLEWMDEPWNEVDAAGDWLQEIAADFQPELIHLNGYVHAALPWNMPVIVAAHSCLLSWWRAVKGAHVPWEFEQYRERVSRGLAAADVVITPSWAMLESLRENYAVPLRARVIYNGHDSSRFSTNHKARSIFAAGRVWDEAKNLRALDLIAPRVAWPIEIAGDLIDSNGRQIILRNARTFGRLTAAGMARKLATSSIFALPARYEPFGLSVLEAALSRCALVLGDIPSLHEIWGGAALFVSPDDSAGLAHTLNELIRDENLRLDFSKRARKRGRELSLERMAVGYQAVYDECANGSRTEAAA